MKKKITIVDYGSGNLLSAKQSFVKVANLNNINGEFKDNELVREVTKFISKDKKRPICFPLDIG